MATTSIAGTEKTSGLEPNTRLAPSRAPNTVAILLRQRFRRDWLQLLIWVAAFAALVAVGYNAIASGFSDPAQRTSIIQVAIATPAILILRGTPQGIGDGAFNFFFMFGFVALLIGLMNTFLAVRHSRADEEAGRSETIGATPAGRLAPLLATVLTALILNIIIGAVTFGVTLIWVADVKSAFLNSAALSAVGLAYFGVGCVAGQIMRTSRGANGLAAAVVVAGYVIRGLADATGTVLADGVSMTASWVKWLSPIGWGQAVAPYTQALWSPLFLCGALFAVAVILTLFLQSHRDIDSSLIPERTGRRFARSTLSGTFAIAVRQLRVPVAGWVVGATLLGVFVGVVGQKVSELVTAPSSGSAKAAFDGIRKALDAQGGGNPIDFFTTAIFAMIGILSAIAGLQAVVRLRNDEASGTAELTLATPVSRLRWFGAHMCVGGIATALVLTGAVVGSAVGLSGVAQYPDRLQNTALAALVQLPAALVIVAVAALVFALIPRWSIALGWAVVMLSVLFGVFGQLFDFPQWLRDFSPFTHVPNVTASSIDWSPVFTMTGAAIFLALLAAFVLRKRNLLLGG